MSDFTAKRIDEMQAGHGGGFVKARAELGVSSFGMQVIQLPPNETGYPEHDHTHDGQEEVYAVLAGSGTMRVGGEELALRSDVLVRVGSGERRHVTAGPDGLRMLVVGGIPGAAYTASPASHLTPVEGGDQPEVGGG